MLLFVIGCDDIGTSYPMLHGIIYPVIAFYLPGGMPVYLFSLLLGFGAALGLLWVGLQSPTGEALQTVNAGLVALFGGLLAGRLAYVAAHWQYFQSHRGEIPQLFLGGLAWPGALAGGVLAVIIYAALTSQSTGRLLDALLPLLGMVVFSVWLACWLEGCAYGPAAQSWWALPARNEWGVIARRLPVQLIGAVSVILTLLLVDRIRERIPFPGQAGLLVLCVLAVQLFALSFLRADPAPSWRGLHLESWAALGLAACFLLALAVLSLNQKLRRRT